MSSLHDGAPCGDPMIAFTIAPTATGGWLWRTRHADGRPRAQGVAPTRKLAAALVIGDIVAARAEDRPAAVLQPTAKAA